MGKVYRQYEVPIPKEEGITVCHTGQRKVMKTVEQEYDREKGYSHVDKIVLGYVCGSLVMNPNDNYRKLYPAEWEKLTGKASTTAVKRLGLYAAVKAVCERTGLSDMLEQAVGKTEAADFLDFSLHSILHHTNVAHSFEQTMREEMLFGGKPRKDGHFSKLFSSLESGQILQFKKLWALHCRDNGVKDVWLCIDGSNDDCHSKGVEIAEKGHAKSGLDVNIVSFTYAVTENGLPVTFELYRGGLVDAKALRLIMAFLKECGLKVKGVILDRGYCDENCMKLLREMGLPYVIMIKTATGYDEVVAELGSKIKLNAEFLVEGTHLFAAQKKTKLFANSEVEDYINVFYDMTGAVGRIGALLDKIYREMARIRQAKDKDKVEISSAFKEFLSIENGEPVISKQGLQAAIDSKGLYGIVCSEPLSCSEVNRLYSCRDSSETQYMIVKTQLGYGKVRVQSTPAVWGRFFTAFVASIIRHYLHLAASQLGIDTCDAVRELDLIQMVSINGAYLHSKAETNKQLQLLSNLGIGMEELDACVKEENNRLAGRDVTLPRYRKTGPKPKRKTTAKAKQRAKLKPGPKPGTKRGEFNKDGTPRKRPGPQKGFKRGPLKADGTPRQKPGPKTGTRRKTA